MAKTIKGITVQIGGDTTGLGKALESVNAKTKDLQSELSRVNKLLKVDPKNTEMLAQKQQILTSAISNTKDKLQQLKGVQVQVQEQFEKGEITEEQYRDFQREIVATEQKLKSLTKQLNEFGSVGAQKVAHVGEKMKEVGGKIENVGQKLIPVSAAAAGALVGVAKGAIDFETAWTGVTKTVDGSPEQLEAVRQGILDLGQSTASSAEDIAATAEAAGQLGVKVDDILSFTETMVRLGDSTNLSSEEAASSIAKLYNVMGNGDDFSTVGNFGAAIVDLGNNFATTEADIMNMATRLASAGANVGLTEQEVLALATTLSSVGLEAEAGGSAISRVMNDIDMAVATNGETLETWASLTGLSVNQFKQKWETDAMGALQMVIGGMGDAKAGGENLNVILDELGITQIRTSDTMRRLTNASEVMNEAVNVSNEAWTKNEALTKESDKRYETTAAKMQQLKGAITELCVSLGETLLPIINTVVETLQKWVNKFNEMSPATQKIVLAVLALTSGLAPLIITIGKVTSAIGTMLTFAPKVVSGFNTMKTGAITAINSLKTTAVAAYAQMKTSILASISSMKTTAISTWTAMKTAAAPIWASIKTAGTTALTTLKTVGTTALSGLRTVLTTFVSFAKTALTGLFNLILAHPVAAVVAAVVALLIVLYNKCDWFREKVNWVVNKIGEFVRKIPGFFQELPSKVVSIGGDIIRGLWNGINNMGSWIREKISGFGKGVLQSLKDFFGIKSPSRVIADEVGRYISEGMGVGIEEHADSPIKATKDVTDDVINAATVNRKLSATFAPTVNPSANNNAALLAKLDGIYDRLNRLKIVLDSGVLVGETIDQIDQRLGERQMLSAMGV